MRDVVSNLNERHHNAQMAGRASVELHTLIFFHGRVAIADARVMKVRSNGLIVFVPKYGIEGPILLNAKQPKVNPVLVITQRPSLTRKRNGVAEFLSPHHGFGKAGHFQAVGRGW